MADVTGSDDVKTIAQEYDCLLIDLDGTVFRGAQPTDGAVQSLSEVHSRKLYVTNNASRSPDEVAAHLRELGFTVTGEDIVTSAQSAAHLLADALPPDSRVLIVGTEALANEITAVGLQPVRRYDDNPVAVVQGLSTTIGWPDLAEAALAIRAGAWYVASNADLTLPTSRGPQPGNGSLVQVLVAATGQHPVVAGKPQPPLHAESIARTGAKRPLVIGDRLDTDIAGAARGGSDSMLVLTGVTDPAGAVLARPGERPTYLASSLAGLLTSHPPVVTAGGEFSCGGWSARLNDAGLDLAGTGEPIDGLRALCAAAWSGGPVTGDAAAAALRRLELPA